MIKMIALLVITTIGISLLGYLMMIRLDGFIESGGFVDGPDALIEKKVLIYAPDHTLSSLETNLTQNHIRFQYISEPHVPENTIPLVLAALSSSDMDNLLLCNEARHINPELFTVAVCNDAIYSRLFKESGITHIFYHDFSVNKLLQWLQTPNSFDNTPD